MSATHAWKLQGTYESAQQHKPNNKICKEIVFPAGEAKK